MSHALVVVALLGGVAFADEPVPVPEGPAAGTAAIDDQGVGATLGIAAGGRVTPGGLRLGGDYLYQLAARDWFDGSVTFTFGGGDAECFRDRQDNRVCTHDFADGFGVELAAGVRRYFRTQGQLAPFVRLAVGVAIDRFGDDDVTGVAIPVHAGGGLRARVAPAVSVVGLAEVAIGLGKFGPVGLEPVASFAIVGGAEFRLK